MAVKQLEQKADKNYWDSLWKTNSYQKTKFYATAFKQYAIMKKHTDKKHPTLEGGCGLSHWVDIFDSEGYDINGVDYAPKVIGRVKKLKPHLKIELGNVFDLNFPDEYFGTYYSWGVVEHFEDGPEPIIKEAFRVLKKGGKLLISVPFWNKKRANHFGEVTSIGKGEFYQYLFSEKEFRTILEQSGFRFHKSYKLNWIKCYRQLKRSNSKLKKKTISNSEESKPKKFLKDPFWKRTIKRIIIKIEDFSVLTSNMGHMILFVVEKK